MFVLFVLFLFLRLFFFFLLFLFLRLFRLLLCLLCPMPTRRCL
jgi:hypothetical protein